VSEYAGIPDLGEEEVRSWWVVVVISVVLGRSFELPVRSAVRRRWPEWGGRMSVVVVWMSRFAGEWLWVGVTSKW
jgi:hypothetical protein